MKINPAQRMLNKITRVIVESAQPEQVIFFGSRAKNSHRPDSDFDFMVVKKNVKNERVVSQRVYRALFEKNIEEQVDIIVVDQNKLKTYRDDPYAIYHWAINEGKVVYG